MLQDEDSLTVANNSRQITALGFSFNIVFEPDGHHMNGIIVDKRSKRKIRVGKYIE